LEVVMAYLIESVLTMWGAHGRNSRPAGENIFFKQSN
jgi:hypothetical protein